MPVRLKDILRLFLVITLLPNLLSCRKDYDKAPEIITRQLIPGEDTTYTAITDILNKGDYEIRDYGFYYGTGIIQHAGGGVNMFNEFRVSLGDRLPADSFSTTIAPNINDFDFYEELRCFVRGYVTDERGTVYGNYVSYPILKLKAVYVYPSSGYAGDSVEIVGYNFNTNPASNLVNFNNANAHVYAASQYRLYVRIPDGIIKNEFSPNVDVQIASRGQQVVMHQIFQLLD